MPDNTVSDDLKRDQAHLIHPLHRPAAQTHAHEWAEGRGSILVDQSGREFIDGLAGLWNVVVGHGRAELADAAARQMKKLAFATGYAGSTNRPAIELPNGSRAFATRGPSDSSSRPAALNRTNRPLRLLATFGG